MKKDIHNSFLVKTPIAHRGFWYEELPENSLGAFESAADNGFAIELDVHRMADGGVAVFHDDNLKRMTGHDANIKDIITRDLEYCKLQGTGFTIPTLGEVVDTVGGKSPLLVEIKSGSKNEVGRLEKSVLNTMQDFPNEWAVQSFNPYVVKWFKENAPEVLRGQLSGAYRRGNDEVSLSAIKKAMLSYMMFNPMGKPDFIGYEANAAEKGLLRRCVIGCSTKNKPLLKWGIHSEEDYRKYGKADNVIFDGFDIRKV